MASAAPKGHMAATEHSTATIEREAPPLWLPDAGVATSPAGCSPSIARLSAALAKAQGQIEGASKDRLNPHFKAAYADLASIWAACRKPLSDNGLAIIQEPMSAGPTVTVITILAHSSGEWVQSALTMRAQQDTPQAIGSCITYARRYALAAIVGVAPEDDDGNEASTGTGDARREPEPRMAGPAFEPPAEPPTFKAAWTKLEAAADEGAEKFKATWDALAPDVKNFILAERKDARRKLSEWAATPGRPKGGKA